MEQLAIAVPDLDGYTPRDPEWGFMRMGYGEVFDIFFAVGLFKLAAQVGFFPDSVTQIFEKLISEEARHIIFFCYVWRRQRAPHCQTLVLHPACGGAR
ncbi:MAG TPA: hypothetical protein VGI36_11840, partial [Candidatus Binataceae bacterium]